ncbi:hypothetical protein D3C71_1927680 [compost metagenome]
MLVVRCWYEPPVSHDCVVDATVMLPPALTLIASVAVTVLPMMSMSCRACRPTCWPLMLAPDRLRILPASIDTS